MKNPSPPLGFAHRGAPAPGIAANSFQAFERALQIGARGLESDVALTADGVPVLAHAGITLPFRTPIGRTLRRDLPPGIPSLADLYDRCGVDFDLSLDMGAPQAIDRVVEIAGDRGALDRLWLTYWRLPALRTWRERWPGLHLVYATLPLSARRADALLTDLAGAGIDAINVHHRFCRKRLLDTAHAKNVGVFVWGVRTAQALDRAVARGVDGVFCDDAQALARLRESSQGV